MINSQVDADNSSVRKVASGCPRSHKMSLVLVFKAVGNKYWVGLGGGGLLGQSEFALLEPF